jgi:tol-pal system protein YbgF
VAPSQQPDLEKAAYDKATQLFQQKQYAAARKEYQSFSAKYPKSELADNALFSAGECYLAEQKYQDAIEVFQQVVDRYPGGNRVPNALLKQGAAFEKLGDATAARILYERIAEKYPGTPQAQIAEKKLK